MPVTYAVVGGGVVGSATAMTLARRGRRVTLFEADAEVGLAASGTNSGILHTGFDSKLGELETALILRAAELRDRVIDGLGIPVMRCGARMRNAPTEIETNARILSVEVERVGDDLVIPGESVTNPIAMTHAFCAEAERNGATIRLGERVEGDLPGYDVVINCAGLYADEVARGFGDDSFAIRARKGEFVVFQNPGLSEILLPVPSPRTKGILAFPDRQRPCLLRSDGRRHGREDRLERARRGACGADRTGSSSCCRASSPSRSSPMPGCGPPVATGRTM